MDSSTVKKLQDFDTIQLSVNGISGVERTLSVPVSVLKEQLENDGCLKFTEDGLPGDPDFSLLYSDGSLVGDVKVDFSTLGPRPWLNRENQCFGGVICEMDSPSGDVISPRSSALRLLQRLMEDHGLVLKSAFEAEMMIYEKDEVTALNNFPVDQYGRVDNIVGRENTLLQACLNIDKAGLPLETFMSELAIGQYEITFCPQEGVASADSIVIMKQALRVELEKDDLVPAFMAVSNPTGHPTGFHFNHSLWTDSGQNAFLDPNDPLLMSDVVRHWMAGLVHHAPALTCLVCPTVNCYGRLLDILTPNCGDWGVENRSTFLRLKNEKKNVYVENRLPSGACNPYLTVAATVAAGLDGLTRRLECPPQVDKDAPAIPKEFGDALEHLEKDTFLVDSVGRDLITRFITLCRKSIKAKKDGLLSNLDQEKSLYLKRI